MTAEIGTTGVTLSAPQSVLTNCHL